MPAYLIYENGQRVMEAVRAAAFEDEVMQRVTDATAPIPGVVSLMGGGMDLSMFSVKGELYAPVIHDGDLTLIPVVSPDWIGTDVDAGVTIEFALRPMRELSENQHSRLVNAGWRLAADR